MKLKPYQLQLTEKALAAINRHRLVYLAMETRTGKTPVSLLTAARTALSEPVDEVLFLTKKSVIPSIQDTYAKLAPNYPDIAAMSLNILSMDSIHKAEPGKNRIIIVDEAHSFGAYPKPSLRAKKLRAISKGCIVIYLSATPTPESYSQIFNQLWAAHSQSPLIAGYDSFYKWAHDYVDIRERRIAAGRVIRDYSRADGERIQAYLAGVTVSITQEEAGFTVHEVKEHFYNIPMPDHINSAVKSITRDQLCFIENTIITAPTAAAKMSKIHQLCSGTVIDDHEDGMIISTHKADKIKFILALYPKIAIYYKYIQEKTC